MPYSFLSMWWGLKILRVQETIETRNIYIKLVNEIRFGHFYPKANDTKGNFLGLHFCYMDTFHCRNWRNILD